MPNARPARARDLAGKLVSVTSPLGRRRGWCRASCALTDDGVPDVMRGEETQIVGCLTEGDPPRRLFVLPGTHSKWAIIEAARITRFATFMTRRAVRPAARPRHPRPADGGDQHDPAAFRRGVEYGSKAGGGLLKRLFSVRTLALFERLPPPASPPISRAC